MAGGIDHLVIVSRDLDQLAEYYQRLGFQVGARNRHDWGTLNHIVQFDGCFLELLTTEPEFVRPADEAPVAPFALMIADYLGRREGLAMMVLEGFDATDDQAVFRKAGIAADQTFYFERQGRRPDGSSVRVAFTLAFARTPDVRDAGFFVCQQHAPEAFWNPAFQIHENGVTGISRLLFAAPDPAALAPFFAAYTGRAPVETGDGRVILHTSRGTVEIATPAHLAADWDASSLPRDLATPVFAGVVFHAVDLDKVERAVGNGGIRHTRRPGALVVGASDAFGVMLAFAAS